MTSVAVVNAYRRYSGSTIAAVGYLTALRHRGYRAEWYQCVDSKDLSEYLPWKNIVPGWTTPIQSLNLAVNRLYGFPRRLEGLEEDLVLATDQVLAGLAVDHPNCLVLVHDLRELDRATRTHVGARILYHFLLPKLRKAQGLLAISEFTKMWIQARLPDAPPIRVVHHGTTVQGNPAGHLRTSLERLEGKGELNVLYVAVDRPYKRIDFFLDLAREVGKVARTDDVQFRFHLISRISPRTARDLERNPIPSLTVRPEVEDLANVWRETDVLVFPSTMEGFGRPLIEAMQFGIPVLALAMEPMREIVGSGGLLLPELDLAAWGSTLRALADPVRLQEASRRSAARGGWFSQSSFESRMVETLRSFGY